MGSKYGAQPPSNTAYFVALAGVLFLLLLLCCYFLYFCVRRVKELSQQEFPEPVKSVRPPPRDPVAGPPRSPRQPAAYPVRPSVRESATAMAHLCQLPPSHTDIVHPRPSPPLPPPRVLPAPHRPLSADETK